MLKPDLLPPGAPAPDFHLQDGEGRTRSLADFSGRWLVLYFYPADDTSGCTNQACGFRQDFSEYEKLGAQIAGVSVNSVESHRRFAERHELPFTLLSDPRRLMCRAYGATYPFLGRYLPARRVTYALDPAGIVRRAWPRVIPAFHSREVISFLKKQKT